MDIPKHPLGGATLNNYMTSGDGKVSIPAFYSIGPSFEEITSALKSYKWRDEDFLLATYLKNGTHFMWEVMMMLVKGSAQCVPDVKQAFMIDMFPVTKIDTLFPSPRVLNTHYRLDVLPAEFKDRKTVVVIRNPKDACVSYYHHETRAMAQIGNGEFAIENMTCSDFIRMFLYNKDIPYGSYFDYIEYMWSLRDNSNILIVFFEDLKLVDFSAEDMKEALAFLYRKGEVGDWKRHFTVADNELFDSFLQDWKVGREIPYKYD